MSRFGRLAPAARRSRSLTSPIISPCVRAAAGKALLGFRACAPCCVLAGAWLEKEPKALGRAVGPCALFGWMVVTWLLMLEFRDQLPNPLLSQRERLPGMQKMGGKKKKTLSRWKWRGGGGVSHPAQTSLPRRVTVVGRGPRTIRGSAGDNPKAGCSQRLSLRGSAPTGCQLGC